MLTWWASPSNLVTFALLRPPNHAITNAIISRSCLPPVCFYSELRASGPTMETMSASKWCVAADRGVPLPQGLDEIPSMIKPIPSTESDSAVKENTKDDPCNDHNILWESLIWELCSAKF